MAEYSIQATDAFQKQVRKFRSQKDLLEALEEKIHRLEQDPFVVGGNLRGTLHGYQSTRLLRTFRLIFKIDPVKRVVHLVALDHRKSVYDR